MELFNRKSFFTAVGGIILLLSLFLTVIVAKNRNIFQSGATANEDPKNVEITNITDTSFTVSYTTDAKVLGTVTSGLNPNNLDTITLDDRDQLSQTVNSYNVHSITLNELKSN